MFPRWWMKLVKENMKGSGYKVTFFMSYNRAMLWNVLEIVLFLYAAISILYFIYPIAGRIAGTLAFIPLIVIWSKVLRTADYHGRNCWYKPPEPKKESFKIFGDWED